MEDKNVLDGGNSNCKGPGVGRVCVFCKKQLQDWCDCRGEVVREGEGWKEKEREEEAE